MQLAQWRPIWLVTMTTALTMFFVGCSRSEAVMPFQDDPVDALCWKVMPSIDEFQEAVDRAGTGDPEVVTRQASSAAKRISSAIEIARRQNVEFEAHELEWIDGLNLAAQAYVALSEGGVAGLSDEEAVAALNRIDEWFRFAADQCLGTNA
jgi:hypothetical protein